MWNQLFEFIVTLLDLHFWRQRIQTKVRETQTISLSLKFTEIIKEACKTKDRT